MLENSKIKVIHNNLMKIVDLLDLFDQMMIIEINDKSKLVTSSVKIDLKGQKDLISQINSFHPEKSSNLWCGISKGIDEAILQQEQQPYRNISILVFTGGNPLEEPEKGLIPLLKEKLNSNKVNFSISTFCYSCDIETDLIEEIAHLGNGIYGF